MTILEVIQRSAEFLGKKGVDSPRLQAELLLAHLLNLPRMRLYLNFERALTAAEQDSYRELVRRRGQREPLQHIVGSTSFCGLEIAVNRHVLVPRPETELLAEFGWQFLNQVAGTVGRPSTPLPAPPDRERQTTEQDDIRAAGNPATSSLPGPWQPSALDFGTGSGCLAVALAVKCPAAQVDAVDFSPEALEVARLNAGRHNLAARLRFFQGDGFAALPAAGRYDLIISNPPYIPSADIAVLQPEVRDYDPRGALDGGADGLSYYRRLASEAGPWLRPGGKLMLEFGDGQAPRLREIFQGQNWIVERMAEDYTQRPRILIMLWKAS